MDGQRARIRPRNRKDETAHKKHGFESQEQYKAQGRGYDEKDNRAMASRSRGRGAFCLSPFSAYIKRFMDRQAAKRRKANTLKSYQDYIDCHIQPKLGNIPTAELTLDVLDKFYSEFLKSHAVSSARKVHVVVKGAVKEAVRDGIFQYNIAERVEFPTSHKFMGAMVYSPAEVDLLLSAAKEAGEPIRAAITLAVCYGMRRSEVLVCAGKI